MDSFDPLEETVGADDYDPSTNSSRNNCPVYLRITAIHQKDIDGRSTYQNSDVRYVFEKEEKKNTRRRLRMWALINGETIATDSHDLADRLSVKYQSISSLKSKAVAIGLDCACIAGVKFGWGEPPKEAL